MWSEWEQQWWLLHFALIRGNSFLYFLWGFDFSCWCMICIPQCQVKGFDYAWVCINLKYHRKAILVKTFSCSEIIFLLETCTSRQWRRCRLLLSFLFLVWAISTFSFYALFSLSPLFSSWLFSVSNYSHFPNKLNSLQSKSKLNLYMYVIIQGGS